MLLSSAGTINHCHIGHACPKIVRCRKYFECLIFRALIRYIYICVRKCFASGNQICESTNRKTLPKAVKCIMKERSAKKRDEHLSKLTVQHRFGGAHELEKDIVRRRMLKGLTEGQFFFMLRAASDTPSTSLNLKRWRLTVGAKCTLCEHSAPTTFHIQNGCPSCSSGTRSLSLKARQCLDENDEGPEASTHACTYKLYPPMPMHAHKASTVTWMAIELLAIL